MIAQIKRKFQSFNELEAFLFKAGLLYIIYYIFRIVMNTYFDDVFYNAFKEFLFKIHITGVSLLLDLFGYEHIVDGRVIKIGDSVGVRVMKACLGTNIMAVFGAFILIYRGKAINKLWYIPSGVTYIIFFNVLRILSLALISYYYFEGVKFYHTYIFKPVLYIFVFALWFIWIKKYSKQ